MGQINEGDLYKLIKIEDFVIEIKYGYYDEKDKYSKYNEPIPIFPNFVTNPIYTTEGYPLVTKMQNKCNHYISDIKSDECFGCKYLKEVEDLIGICICSHNRRMKKN